MSKDQAFGPAYDAYRRRMMRPAPDPTGPRPYHCKGGPFDYQTIYLHSPDTLDFSLGGQQRGRYELGDKSDELVWEDAGPLNTEDVRPRLGPEGIYGGIWRKLKGYI